MERASLSRRLRVWYRLIRRRIRALRLFCISLLSVMLMVNRVLEIVTLFLDGGSLS
jgi:hypothetical protein